MKFNTISKAALMAVLLSTTAPVFGASVDAGDPATTDGKSTAVFRHAHLEVYRLAQCANLGFSLSKRDVMIQTTLPDQTLQSEKMKNVAEAVKKFFAYDSAAFTLVGLDLPANGSAFITHKDSFFEKVRDTVSGLVAGFDESSIQHEFLAAIASHAKAPAFLEREVAVLVQQLDAAAGLFYTPIVPREGAWYKDCRGFLTDTPDQEHLHIMKVLDAVYKLHTLYPMIEARRKTLEDAKSQAWLDSLKNRIYYSC